MFQRLNQKWKVNGLQLFLIVCVFAITGTTTAYLTRQVTIWLKLQPANVIYWLLKIVMLIFGYQVLILFFAIPFRQFAFFWNYEKKILRRMGLLKHQITKNKNQIIPITIGTEIRNTKPENRSLKAPGRNPKSAGDAN